METSKTMSLRLLSYDSPYYIASSEDHMDDSELADAFVDFLRGDGVVRSFFRKNREDMNLMFAIGEFLMTKDEDYGYEQN